MSALELTGVRHTFAGRTALDGLDLAVAPGEVVALVGLNGAGKTTALRVLTGRLRPDGGRARVHGQDPARLTPAAARRFGHCVGAGLVDPDLTVRENLRTAALLHGLDRGSVPSACAAALDRLDLGAWADARARTLSAGNAQRLGIACAAVHTPAALVLDEPTATLDPRGVVVVRTLVRSLADAGAAVLVSSHHLDEVARVADRVLVVHAGRVVGGLAPGAEMEQRFFGAVLAADGGTR
ncbi:ABC transporter ATP-binding protein [Isoptericola dokdonensis]|uniref:Daunorubicin/doxorubicin resistance ATP-binding protein DrrA n=1 Tax=Isoptericola dokdonensis DS-3 TaxID=1300344 RepID=A0A168FST7_9MICO|nr:ABC transporter ATP-binding protein [Isoptericola dokdonensis]ANC32430.1 Daunorubicin/doxorubicin resistance ATP-binding protein DrrA [Isoptericola dokdonensis DS-3]